MAFQFEHRVLTCQPKQCQQLFQLKDQQRTTQTQPRNPFPFSENVAQQESMTIYITKESRKRNFFNIQQDQQLSNVTVQFEGKVYLMEFIGLSSIQTMTHKLNY